MNPGNCTSPDSLPATELACQGKGMGIKFSQFIVLPQSSAQPPDTHHCVIPCLHFCSELTTNKEASSALRRNEDSSNFTPPFRTVLRFHSFKTAYQLLLKLILLQRALMALHNSPLHSLSTLAFANGMTALCCVCKPKDPWMFMEKKQVYCWYSMV